MMTLVFLPCLIVLTVMVSEIGSLYVAKTELRHCLESGALAAVRHLRSEKLDTAGARAAAVSFTSANLVRGECIDLTRKVVLEPASEDSPERIGIAGRVTFGNVVASKTTGWVFVPDLPPDRGGFPAVQLEMRQPIVGNVSEIFGMDSPNYRVEATVTARLNGDEEPELVRINAP